MAATTTLGVARSGSALVRLVLVLVLVLVAAVAFRPLLPCTAPRPDPSEDGPT
ncbi:hypothetical protein [Streptomyces tsukubensis]|uniref:hypothetical protein n=1 Tax=Streptomyces tsukubensis TaxID=83656 RepID=UPI0015C3B90F|nr:hypothetical protein [Streptomyces tsukubensis]